MAPKTSGEKVAKKKLVLKKKDTKKESKKLKTKKVAEPAAKTKKVKYAAPSRKINNKPVLADEAGINISPAKVKNIIANHVLNAQAYKAICAIKAAMPVDVVAEVKDSSGKITTKAQAAQPAKAGTPVASLDAETKAYIKFAEEQYVHAKKKEVAKDFIHDMDKATRAKYSKAKHDAKLEYEKTDKDFLETGEFDFDFEKFNTKFDKSFYANYKDDVEGDEWKRAITHITKLKVRFSTNSRVVLAAFAECLIRQLAANGTVSCISEKKKIIQLSHVLDTTADGFEERFPLYPLITTLSTFKQGHAMLKRYADITKGKASKDPEEVNRAKEAESKETDTFTLDGVSAEKQHQFRYYISETCRQIRMKLAKSEKDDKGNPMDVYNLTSVSKVFKNFCSTLVCEILMRVGVMLDCEIDTRGIKTVNDTIIGTVLSHYHTVCGVNVTPTTQFIRDATKKYHEFTKKRQSDRGKGDMDYEED